MGITKFGPKLLCKQTIKKRVPYLSLMMSLLELDDESSWISRGSLIASFELRSTKINEYQFEDKTSHFHLFV